MKLLRFLASLSSEDRIPPMLVERCLQDRMIPQLLKIPFFAERIKLNWSLFHYTESNSVAGIMRYELKPILDDGLIYLTTADWQNAVEVDDSKRQARVTCKAKWVFRQSALSENSHTYICTTSSILQISNPEKSPFVVADSEIPYLEHLPKGNNYIEEQKDLLRHLKKQLDLFDRAISHLK